MQRIVFIINPISGTGRKDAVKAAIAAHLDAERFEPIIRYTERAGHAAEIAREEAERGTDIVVAVGGDGTVNEVARSLVGSGTALAIVPCGSGNGLARHLRLPLDAVKAVELINENHQQRLDYGTMNGVPFFCTCGVGFDAFISQKFAESGKRGVATYVEKMINDGLHYKPEHYHVEIDGEAMELDAFLITCANASQYGNNAYIAPDASTRDGLLDVTILKPFPTYQALHVLMQMLNRNLSASHHAQIFRARHVRIVRSGDGPAHIDGDPMTVGHELDIQIHPAALLCVTNGHPGHRPMAFGRLHTFNREVDDLQRNFRREFHASFVRNFIEPWQRHSDTEADADAGAKGHHSEAEQTEEGSVN